MVNVEDDPYRHSVFLERAVVGERIRVAMGMAIRPVNEHTPTSKGVDESMIEEKYYEPPLIDIIRFACHCCPDTRVYITDGCQVCLEHPCREVCPKKCISYDSRLGRNVIDTEKCIKCGMCMKACQYNAIIRQERPCVKACGLGAIGEDEYGHAMIDQEKCVSCGDIPDDQGNGVRHTGLRDSSSCNCRTIRQRTDRYKDEVGLQKARLRRCF